MAVELQGGRQDHRVPVAGEFAPIQQLRAHEYVAEQIRRHIALRLIKPGDALASERELAVMFGVGRPTVQHALRLLEADRLVETRRGRHGGTFVSQPAEDDTAMEDLIARVLRSRREIDEVLAYRRAIEPRVAREAAARRQRIDIRAMANAISRMSRASSEPEYMRNDNEFHLAVASASRNRFMIGAIEDIRMRLGDVISLLPETDAWHARLSGEHEAIATAIELRDCETAETTMETHVAASEQSVRAVLTAIRRGLGS